MENNLFLGLEPYQTSEAQYLPQRDSSIRMLKYMLRENSLSILTSEAKTGKTSLINAAFTPEELAQAQATAIRFDIPPFHFGDQVLCKQLTAAFHALCTGPTYLDLCLDDDQSMWYAAKKLQARYKDSKKFYIIFDSFENLLTYGNAARNEFATAIQQLIQGDTPIKYQEQIQKIVMGQSDAILPAYAMPLLIDQPRFHILISISKDHYPYLAQLNSIIRGILQKSMEITAFDVETAKAAIPQIASQPIEGMPQITIQPEAIDSIVSHFAKSGGTVNPGQLKNAILYLRTLPGASQYGTDELQKSQLLQKNATEALSLISPAERESLSAYITREMVMENESQPLPSYRGIALQRYHISAETLQTMESHYILRRSIGQDSRIYYLPYSIEVLREIQGTQLTGTQLTGTQLTGTSSGNRQPIPAPMPAAFASQLTGKNSAGASSDKKIRISRTAALAIATVFLTCLATIFLAFSMKSDADRNANTARSNMLSATAFQKLETDPTLSLRLAQRAIGLDSANYHAYSALLYAFYNTDIFYNIAGYIEPNAEGSINKTEISDGEPIYVKTYVKDYETNTYAARIMDARGNTAVEIPHSSEVLSISIAAGRILTTSDDSTARIFGTDGQLKTTIRGHHARLGSGCISPDGTRIATGGSDGNIMVWDMDGNLTATLRGHEFDVYSLQFSPDGGTILSSSDDNTARLWSADGKTCRILEIKGPASIISQAVLSPCGRYVLVASNDRSNTTHRARLMDIDGREIMTYEGHGDFINSVNFSPDGRHIITSCRDKIVRVFNINGKLEKVLKGHDANVWCARFQNDNNSIISVGDDHTIRTWSIGKRFESFDKATNIGGAGFSPNGQMILLVQDSVARVWMQNGEEVAALRGHSGRINKARFSSNSRMIITASCDGTARIWTNQGDLIRTIQHDGAQVNDGAFSNDGRYAVTVTDNSRINIQDIQQGILKTITAHSGNITCVSITPNGNAFATGGGDGNIIIHDMEGNEVRKFHAHDGTINSLSFSPNGQYIVTTSSDHTAMLWNTQGQKILLIRGYEYKMNSATFSPDSRYIATTSDDGTARLCDTEGREIMTFKHDGKVSDAVFSPDGKYILTVYRTAEGMKTIKMRMLNPDGITRHIDELSLYGEVWQPDSATLKKYGLD